MARKSKKVLVKSPKKKAVKANPTPDLTAFYTAGFWKENWWKALLLFVLPLIMYYQATSYGYVLDDLIVIQENTFTKQGFAGIDDLMTTESMTGYFGEQKNLVQGNRYRPLSLITFAIEDQIMGGEAPWLSHLINILLYGLTGLLLFRVLSMMFRKVKPSIWWLGIPFLASLMYITHPIHSEAVANIKGRDEILALLFSLLTLYTSLRYVDTKKKTWMAASFFSLFIALLAKENSITFLAVIPLTIYFFSNHTLKDNFKAFIPLIVSTIGYLILRFSVAGVPDFGAQVTDLMNNPFLGMSGGEKMGTIMFTLYKYLQLYVFPHPLSHDYYPYAIPVVNWGDIRAFGSLLIHLVLFGFALYGFKKKKIYSYAILYYFATLTIVSNIVVNLGTFMNERFIFMASVGLALLVAYLLSEKLGKWNGNTGIGIATAIFALCTIGYITKTFDRVPDWTNAMTLNESAVKNGTNSARANSFMATALYEDSKELTGFEKSDYLQDAMKYAEKAISLYPKYQNANLMKAGIAAGIYGLDRNDDLLLERFADVMSRRPDVTFLNTYLDYYDSRTNDIDKLINWYVETSMNEVLKESKQPQWALHFLNRAYKLDNNNIKVLDATAKVYSQTGDSARAESFAIKAKQAAEK